MGVIDQVNEVWEIAQALNDAQLLKATADLKLECAQLVEQNAELLNQNTELKKEVAALKQQLAEREEVFFDENVLWRRKEDEGREGPFCPKCYSANDKIVPMQERSEWHADYYECPICHDRPPRVVR